jgi:hypothetical protein
MKVGHKETGKQHENGYIIKLGDSMKLGDTMKLDAL